MLLSQSNCREAFAAELGRRLDRVRRWLTPRPPVRLIAIDPGDLCAFCHEELLSPAPGEGEEEATDGEVGRVARATEGIQEGIQARLPDALVRPYVNGGLAVRHAAARAIQLANAIARHVLPVVAAVLVPAASAVLRALLIVARPLWALLARLGRTLERRLGDGRDDAAVAGAGSGTAGARPPRPPRPPPLTPEEIAEQQRNIPAHVIHCSWGCGKAVHRSCADAWGRNACVYCSAPMR